MPAGGATSARKKAAPASPLEADLKATCRRYAQKRDCLLLVINPPPVGIPDRLLVGPEGVVFVEFKRPGKYPTEIQQAWLWWLRKMGQKADVVRSLDDFKILVDLVSKGGQDTHTNHLRGA